MAFEIDARMHTTPCGVGELSQIQMLNGSNFRTENDRLASVIDKSSAIATIQWNSDPSLGVPVAPYDVELCYFPVQKGLEYNTPRFDVLSLTANRPHSFRNFLAGRPYSEGALYIRAANVIGEGEIYARDFSGQEMSGTRQPLSSGDPILMFCPGIYEIVATQDTVLEDVRIGIVPGDREVKSQLLARVAPVLTHEFAPYEQFQEILGVNYHSHDALRERNNLDMLARSFFDDPFHSELDHEVHRRDPMEISASLFETDFMRVFAAEFEQVINQPARSFTQSLELQDDETLETTMLFSNTLQMLSLLGSVEATTLGMGISLPLDYPKAEVLEAFLRNRSVDVKEDFFPLPILRVSGYFYNGREISASWDAETMRRSVRKFTSYVRYDQVNAVPTLNAIANTPYAPPSRDAHALCKAQLNLSNTIPTASYFVERNGPSQQNGIVRDTFERPKHFLATEDIDHAELNTTTFYDGPLNLSFVEEEVVEYGVHPRTQYGQWMRPRQTNLKLPMWKQFIPVILHSEQGRGQSATNGIELMVDWSLDWTKRTPERVNFTLTLYSESTQLVVPVNLSVSFVNHDPHQGNVQINNASTLASIGNLSASIHYVEPTAVDDASGPLLDNGQPSSFDREGFDEHQFRFVFTFEDPDALFTAQGLYHSQVAFTINGTSHELVAPTRPAPLSNTLSGKIFDNRPPEIETIPFDLFWASFADATRFSRSNLKAPKLTGSIPGTLQVWRATESSVIDWLNKVCRVRLRTIRSQILRQSDMQDRLEGFKNLMLNNNGDVRNARSFVDLFRYAQDVASEEEYSLQHNGRQSGLEFVFYSARSETGIESNKESLIGLTAIAVPMRTQQNRLLFDIVTSDDYGLLEQNNQVLLTIGSFTRFTDDDVLQFYVDRGSHIRQSDDLLYNFSPDAEISQADLQTYFSKPGRDVVRHIMAPYKRYFLATPKRSWGSTAYCVELRKTDAVSPSQRIPSPRSNMIWLDTPPLNQPRFSTDNANTVRINQLNSYESDYGASSLRIVDLSSTGALSHDFQCDQTTPEEITNVLNVISDVRWERDALVIEKSGNSSATALNLKTIDPLGREEEYHW